MYAIVLWCTAKLKQQEESREDLADSDQDESHNFKTTFKKKTEGEADAIAGLTEVIQSVNWDFVSLPCMVDLVRTHAFFRQNSAFQKIL